MLLKALTAHFAYFNWRLVPTFLVSRVEVGPNGGGFRRAAGEFWMVSFHGDGRLWPGGAGHLDVLEGLCSREEQTGRT